jgi:hypothetical protein
MPAIQPIRPLRHFDAVSANRARAGGGGRGSNCLRHGCMSASAARTSLRSRAPASLSDRQLRDFAGADAAPLGTRSTGAVSSSGGLRLAAMIAIRPATASTLPALGGCPVGAESLKATSPYAPFRQCRANVARMAASSAASSACRLPSQLSAPKTGNCFGPNPKVQCLLIVRQEAFDRQIAFTGVVIESQHCRARSQRGQLLRDGCKRRS